MTKQMTVFSNKVGSRAGNAEILRNTGKNNFCAHVYAALLLEKTFKPFIVNNQPEIKKGILPTENAFSVNKLIEEKVRNKREKINKTFVQPNSYNTNGAKFIIDYKTNAKHE